MPKGNSEVCPPSSHMCDFLIHQKNLTQYTMATLKRKISQEFKYKSLPTHQFMKASC